MKRMVHSDGHQMSEGFKSLLHLALPCVFCLDRIEINFGRISFTLLTKMSPCVAQTGSDFTLTVQRACQHVMLVILGSILCGNRVESFGLDAFKS